MEKLLIAFVCMGNTCRSLMAEYITRARASGDLRIESAGLRPQNPEDGHNAIEALFEIYSIDASLHKPKGVQNIGLDSFDVVVAMDKGIARALRNLTNKDIVVWNINDPWGDNHIQYRRTAILINENVRKLLNELGVEIRDS